MTTSYLVPSAPDEDYYSLIQDSLLVKYVLNMPEGALLDVPGLPEWVFKQSRLVDIHIFIHREFDHVLVPVLASDTGELCKLLVSLADDQTRKYLYRSAVYRRLWVTSSTEEGQVPEAMEYNLGSGSNSLTFQLKLGIKMVDAVEDAKNGTG